MNKQLGGHDFLAGAYSIADMACYPWIVPWKIHQQNLAEFPDLHRWFEAIRARPAVQRAYEKGKAWTSTAPMSDEQRKVLFGQTAAAVKV